MIHESLYHTHLNILIFLCIDVMKRIIAGLCSQEFGCLGHELLCTCSVCERDFVSTQTLIKLCFGAKQDEDICGFWCPHWDFHGTYRQTTKTCDGLTLILLFEGWWWKRMTNILQSIQILMDFNRLRRKWISYVLKAKLIAFKEKNSTFNILH